jgi:aminoglycoside 6'-N-acetyltransferase
MSADDTQREDTDRRRQDSVERNQRARAQGDVADELARLEVAERPGMILRTLAEGDKAELLRILSTPEVVHWWDVPDEGFPLTDDPESTRLTIEVDGAVAGLIQFSEELEPKYRHASIDLFLDPALHGRGLGTEAVRRVVRYLIDERGHHRITIDPAVANAAAIRTYEKVGFRPVGIMRRYERDVSGRGWHDGLLMELLAGEE